MPGIWSSILVQLALALLAGGLIGWIYDQAILGMLLVALAALAWHVYNLYRLERWLTSGSRADIPDGDGVWPSVFARIQFIKTKAKRRGKRFQRLVRELRASAEVFPDGGVILNAQNEILNYNQAARLLLDLKPRGDRGQRIENLLRHPDFVDYLHRPGGRPAVEIPSPAGGEAWLSCRLIPYGPGQTLLLIRDISQRVKIERVRRDFVANASHELRTPLTVIMGYLDTLGEDPEQPSAWQQPVRVMQEQLQRMSRLVDDLLQLSRLESGQPVAKDRVVNVAGLIELARRDAQGLPGFAGQIGAQIDSDLNLLGEETELQSVVSNLVANAVRYTPAEGSITIRWNVDQEGGHLAVVDTGIGMSEVDIPRVTERFYRADGGRARQSGGTGLGLSIVKYALRRHDADLEIRSKLGQGSSFICHFPRDRLTPS